MPPEIQTADEELSNAKNLGLITENGLLQGWETNTKGAKQALRYGLLPTETVTGKAISALGEYRIQCLQRKYYRGIQSNRHDEKLIILNDAQRAIEALQPLELLINNGAGKQKISKAIKQVVSSLKGLNKENNFFENQIKILKLSKKKELSSDEIQNIIKNQVAAIIQTAKSLNQHLTYQKKTFALTRGDFHDCCENALKIVRDYQPDFHRRILPAHQGIYKCEESQKIQIDLSHLNDDPESLRKTLMAICKIKGKDKEIEIEETKFVSWHSTLHPAKRFVNTLLTVPNLLRGTCGLQPIENFLPQQASLFTEVATYLKNKKLEEEKSILIKIKCCFFRSLPYKLIIYAVEFSKATLYDSFNLLIFSLQSIVNLISDIYHDFNTTKKTKNKLIEKKFSNNKDNKKLHDAEKEIIFANPIYHLSSFNDETNDLLSFPIKIMTHSLGELTHSVYEQNPFLGLMFNVTAVLGGLSAATPHLLHQLFHWKGITKPFSLIGKTIPTNNVVTKTFYSALLPAKLLVALLEITTEGTNCSLARFMDRLANNPNNVILFTVIASAIATIIPDLKSAIPIVDMMQKIPNIGGVTTTKGILEITKTIANSQKGIENTEEYIESINQLHIKDKNKSNNTYKIAKTNGISQHFKNREIYNKLIEQFDDDKDMENFAYQVLLAPPKGGLFFTTGTIIINHVTLIVRCLLTPITLSLTPWKLLANQLIYDYALVSNAAAITFHAVTELVRAIVTGMADVIWNTFFMRAVGAIMYNSEYSCVHQLGCEATKRVSEAKTAADYWCGFFSGTNAARRKATEANAAFSNYYHANYYHQRGEMAAAAA